MVNRLTRLNKVRHIFIEPFLWGLIYFGLAGVMAYCTFASPSVFWFFWSFAWTLISLYWFGKCLIAAIARWTGKVDEGERFMTRKIRKTTKTPKPIMLPYPHGVRFNINGQVFQVTNVAWSGWFMPGEESTRLTLDLVEVRD